MREWATKGLGCQGLLAQAVLSTEKWLALSPPGVAGQGKAGDMEEKEGWWLVSGSVGHSTDIEGSGIVLVMQGDIVGD